MKCSICKMEIKEWDKTYKSHLMLSKDVDGHVHTHGDLEHHEDMQELIDVATEETKTKIKKAVLDRKEIVFHNKQRIGDMLMFTCGIRDFKKAFPEVRVNVLSTAQHLWDFNPYIDRKLRATPENTIKIGPSKLTNSSNRLDWHFANAFRVSIEDALHVPIEQGVSRPDIWMTEEEYHAERVIKEPYWILSIGGEKSWGCKMYPVERWQEFVNQNPDVKFLQIGSREDDHSRLTGDNVIDYIGKTQDRDTGIRDLVKLFFNAEGSIGLVSFHMHLSGALYKPAIVIGGAREPVSFVRYACHQFLATDGCLPCAAESACWHCDINSCTNLVIGKEKVPKCVDIIYPEDLTRTLNSFYLGGRLKKGEISAKPKKFKNIVPTPPKAKVYDIKKYNMEWGGSQITDSDWEFMLDIIKENNVKTVIEFGTGLSSLLMKEEGLSVTSYEVSDKYADTIKLLNKDLDIRIWDGKTESQIDGGLYDMAFVNGPAGGKNREFSTKISAQMAKVVIIHDAEREHEKIWQEKYLKNSFKSVLGGSRCNAWVANDVKIEKIEEVQKVVPDYLLVDSTQCCKIGKKFIKFVSTARGWGGCGRSIATIMKHLLKEGHKVEFIPFRNSISCRELREYIRDYLPDLLVTENYNTLQEQCDVLFMYGDDYIWEFEKQEIIEAFSNIGADSKIMMLNYRRGKVGEIPWTRDWNKYMFLNSTQEKELLKVHPGVKTKVLPPCTELDTFFAVQPTFTEAVKIVRHSSQGDTKFVKDNGEEIWNMMKCRSDINIDMLPGPSFAKEGNDGKYGFWKHPRTDKPEVIAEFLSRGNLFWYSLPIGYMDMGPRVIIEAMAAGLPILADNWGGAVDRVTPECGWLCNTKAEMLEIVTNVTLEELKKKGEAARERAKTFKPEAWIEEIINV